MNELLDYIREFDIESFKLSGKEVLFGVFIALGLFLAFRFLISKLPDPSKRIINTGFSFVLNLLIYTLCALFILKVILSKDYTLLFGIIVVPLILVFNRALKAYDRWVDRITK